MRANHIRTLGRARTAAARLTLSLALGFVLLTAGEPTLAAESEPKARDPAEDRAIAIERSIEQAREQLDEAARRLASLHSEMWRIETEGPRAKRPMLGVLVDDSGASQGGIDLVGVTPGSGAEEAGLEAGDRIVMINGVRLDRGGEQKPMHLLSQAMSTVTAGDPVTVEYVRDGEMARTEVVTHARGTYMASVIEEKAEWLEGLQALQQLEHLKALEGLEELGVVEDINLGDTVLRVPAGLRLEEVQGELAGYFDVDHGVLVLGTPKREQSLKPGDILLEIDDRPVTGADAVLEHLAKLEGEVSATVRRKGQVREVTLNADALNAEHALHVTGSDRRIRIQRGGDPVRVEIIVDE